jgi:purine nucleoside phosphorylase
MHMSTLEDCIGMCGLTEEAIAEHEHLPEFAATALAHNVIVGTTHRSRWAWRRLAPAEARFITRSAISFVG